jgi:hypothetical protein
VGLPEPIARLLEAGPERLLEQRENPTRILWPHGGAGAGLPVLEFHEEPLPPYLYGPYRQDVAK